MKPLDQYIKNQLEAYISRLERILNCDIMSIISPIVPGLEIIVRDAIEKLSDKKEGLAIVIETAGGIVEVVERMVNTIRHHYKEVTFIVPNVALSAGTVFVMSGDKILMDYFSCLGPIDPQIEKDGKLVPATSYLLQFERLNEKAKLGELTTAEYALLSKLDLGELHQFEQARELSVELLKRWLSKYKFKNWERRRSTGETVSMEMKEQRAKEIAEGLNDPERWHTHGRGINKDTLIRELRLLINDFSDVEGLKEEVSGYFELLLDYMYRGDMRSFVNTKGYF